MVSSKLSLTVKRLSLASAYIFSVTSRIFTKSIVTTLKIFRRTEKLSFRSKKLQDIQFLRLCKNYQVIPNFVNLRVHNPIFYLYFEKLCASLKNCDIYNNNFNNVTNNITTIANNSFGKLSQQRRQGFNSDVFLSPLQTLKNDNTIVITKADKGRVVILNKCDYEQKLMDILSDKTKFKQITTKISTHLLYLEDKLNRLLRTIKASININTYNSLMTSGSRPGVLYGLPKVHEPNIPLRPIISSIGTSNYNTAKFLVPIISPITSNQYTIDNSTSFAKEITSLNFQQPVTMASFDVESLFTNVPLQETTELIANNLDNTYLDKYGLDTFTFKKLLEITAHYSVFTFNDCLYTQTDGVAMGSPLGPSYANTFLCHHEKSCLFSSLYYVFDYSITNILRKNVFPINFNERNIKKTLSRLLVPQDPLLIVPKDSIYVLKLSTNYCTETVMQLTLYAGFHVYLDSFVRRF
nr:uncharacterized protein LOC113812157 [Penaeus vannamei]